MERRACVAKIYTSYKFHFALIKRRVGLFLWACPPFLKDTAPCRGCERTKRVNYFPRLIKGVYDTCGVHRGNTGCTDLCGLQCTRPGPVMLMNLPRPEEACSNGLSADSAALASGLLTAESRERYSQRERECKNAILAKRDKWRVELACI